MDYLALLNYYYGKSLPQASIRRLAGRQEPVGVQDKFLCYTGVEVGVALGCFAEGKNCRVYDFGDRQAFIEDGLHELAIVLKYGSLASVKAV